MRDTIAAVATPPGVGALAIVRVGGTHSCRLLLAVLKRNRPLPSRVATLCQAFDANGPIDRVVATFFPGPDSATGEDVVELTCHGSPYIVERLLAALTAAGARLAGPGEFTQRAYLNGRLDLAQAEAVGELIRARSEAAHRAALRRLDGGLSRELESLRAPILGLLVRVEACLDHPGEDIADLGADALRAALEPARRRALALAASQRQGRLLAEGARVAIVGRPNAGKSSLLNALLGFDRAIVRPEPGTTRDTLEEPVALDGGSAVLIDTAGIRPECGDPTEREGIARARGAVESCDLALFVLDGARESDASDEQVIESVASSGRPVLTVLSKSDLSTDLARAKFLRVSALTRAGLPELKAEISRRLGVGPIGDSEPIVISSLRHRDSLARFADELALAAAAPVAHGDEWEDRAACHLRAALGALDEIVGAAAPDEVLQQIFSKFCVGK